MIRKVTLILIGIYFQSYITAFGQLDIPDSLKNIYSVSHDSIRCRILSELGEAENDPKSEKSAFGQYIFKEAFQLFFVRRIQQ
jgi:hypothetical protein